MKHASEMGMNRTGIKMAPRLKDAMTKGAQSAIPTESATGISDLRMSYGREAPTVGSTPPPASVSGVMQTGKEMLKGNRPEVLVDKLGERLAFERTGTRLYEALLCKFDTEGGWSNGPSREVLKRFHDEEHAHFKLVKEAIESLGGDPTAVTPSADMAGVASEGLLKVVADPRSSMVGAMEAILIAELADHDGWEMLIKLSDDLGQKDLADRFRGALKEEDEHLGSVRSWLTHGITQEAKGELH